jgi:hypothetical protein
MRPVRSVLPLLVVLATLLAAGCGSPSAASAAKATATPKPTATPQVAHFAHVAHTGQSAPQLLAGFKAKGLPIGESVTYTHPPGHYIDKVNFKDTRIPDSGNHDVNIAVDDGGSIEVFATQGLSGWGGRVARLEDFDASSVTSVPDSAPGGTLAPTHPVIRAGVSEESTRPGDTERRPLPMPIAVLLALGVQQVRASWQPGKWAQKSAGSISFGTTLWKPALFVLSPES